MSETPRYAHEKCDADIRVWSARAEKAEKALAEAHLALMGLRAAMDGLQADGYIRGDLPDGYYLALARADNALGAKS